MFTDEQGLIDLESISREHIKRLHINHSTARLHEKIIKNGEGQLARYGSVVVRTSSHQVLPAEDRFIVRDSDSEDKVSWNELNKGIARDHFYTIFNRLLAYLQDKELYVQNCCLGSDPDFMIPIRIITETAWHSLFARNMFIQLDENAEQEPFTPDFSIVHIPSFQANPETDGTHSSSFMIVNLKQKVVFIGGTSYAGEIKQAIFTIANYLYPEDSVFSMRCAANVGKDGDVAIFLGREGTGKTALSADPSRKLFADHFLGWTADGMFNLESGCYAKVFKLNKNDEPGISECVEQFGTVLENVSLNPRSRHLNLDNGNLTENSRAAYAIKRFPNSIPGGKCGHPKNIFLLTCDVFGVFPPISKLTPELAVYAFLSNYTSQIVDNRPEKIKAEVMFEVCFGDSLLAYPAHFYGERFMEKIVKHNINCWLVNTGWSGESYDSGERIPISQTRALIKAAVSGDLDNVSYETDPIFQYQIPKQCPGVPENILNPRLAAKDESEYNFRAVQLAQEILSSFAQFEEQVPENMRAMMSNIITLDDSYDLVDSLDISM